MKSQGVQVISIYKEGMEMISNKLLVSRPSLCFIELVTISTKHKEGNINRNMRRSTISTLCKPKESYRYNWQVLNQVASRNEL